MNSTVGLCWESHKTEVEVSVKPRPIGDPPQNHFQAHSSEWQLQVPKVVCRTKQHCKLLGPQPSTFGAIKASTLWHDIVITVSGWIPHASLWRLTSKIIRTAQYPNPQQGKWPRPQRVLHPRVSTWLPGGRPMVLENDQKEKGRFVLYYIEVCWGHRLPFLDIVSREDQLS